mgnify:CR=1 FL=1
MKYYYGLQSRPLEADFSLLKEFNENNGILIEFSNIDKNIKDNISNKLFRYGIIVFEENLCDEIVNKHELNLINKNEKLEKIEEAVYRLIKLNKKDLFCTDAFYKHLSMTEDEVLDVLISNGFDDLDDFLEICELDYKG